MIQCRGGARAGRWLPIVLAALLAVLPWQPVLADADDRAMQARRALALTAKQPEIGEPALLGLLLQVQQAEPDLADQPWLQQIADYQPQIRQPHDHADHVLESVYPVDVIAKGQLNRLQREVRRLQGVRWLRYPDRFIAAYQAEKRWPVGYLDALESADEGQREALRHAIGQTTLDSRLADLLGELALLRGDADELVKAIALADPVRAGRWLNGLQAGKSAHYGKAMAAAQARSDLAGLVAALRLSETRTAASIDREDLIAQLADPRLGSAAILPLARGLDPARLQTLRMRLEQTDDPLLRRRLLQVIRAAPPALSADVAKLTADPAFLLQLDQESRAWLIR